MDSYGFSADTPKRSSLMAVQTPQCFRFIDALKAYSDMEMLPPEELISVI